ncbi:hypothetical protein QJS66_03715 [Kocuria rhizophila]|nr:hypothetical protein QJS66_03715 [Kocuria rhizophila]
MRREGAVGWTGRGSRRRGGGADVAALNPPASSQHRDSTRCPPSDRRAINHDRERHGSRHLSTDRAALPGTDVPRRASVAAVRGETAVSALVVGHSGWLPPSIPTPQLSR